MRLQWLGFATTSFFSALMLWTYFLTISVENFEACSVGYLSEWLQDSENAVEESLLDSDCYGLNATAGASVLSSCPNME